MGTELHKGQELCKDTGKCSDKLVVGNNRLEIEDNGNMVLYNGANLVWLVEGQGIVRLKMQTDGNLVAYDANMDAKWASSWGSNGAHRKCCHGLGVRVVLQSDGNLVLYTWDDFPAWAVR